MARQHPEVLVVVRAQGVVQVDAKIVLGGGDPVGSRTEGPLRGSGMVRHFESELGGQRGDLFGGRRLALVQERRCDALQKALALLCARLRFAQEGRQVLRHLQLLAVVEAAPLLTQHEELAVARLAAVRWPDDRAK